MASVVSIYYNNGLVHKDKGKTMFATSFKHILESLAGSALLADRTPVRTGLGAEPVMRPNGDGDKWI